MYVFEVVSWLFLLFYSRGILETNASTVKLFFMKGWHKTKLQHNAVNFLSATLLIASYGLYVYSLHRDVLC